MTALRTRAGPRVSQPGFVLRRFPYGESSLIVHLLTPEHGRVALMAKGAYRPSSGFYAVFDLFDTLEIRWSGARAGELGLVSAASVRTRRPALGLDLERYRTGLSLLELAGVTAREGHEERTLHAWLEGHLDLLQVGRAAPELVRVASDLALLRANGLAPALAECASCGRRGTERSGNVPFSAARGGRLCAACAATGPTRGARGPRPESVPLNLVRVAESLMETSPARLERIRVEARLLRQVRGFVERFLEYHLETRLWSRHPRR